MAIAAVVLGVAALHITFRAFQSQWPTSYHSIRASLDNGVSRSPIRYGLFRFGPVVVVSAVTAVLLARENESVIVPVVAIGVLHACVTAGWALLSLARSGQILERPALALFRVIVFGGCVGSAIVGIMVAPLIEGTVPSATDMQAAAWTGLIAAVGGAYILHLTARPETDTDEAWSAVRARIPGESWDQATQASAQYDAELVLVRSVMLVEELQRPKWARWVERKFGRFVGRGTYGPLQASSGEPMDDLQAIDAAISERFAKRSIPKNEYDDTDNNWIEAFFHLYNPDPIFRENAWSAYNHLTWPKENSEIHSPQRALDNLPVVEVVSISYDGSEVAISGTAWATVPFMIIEAFVDGEPTQTQVPVSISSSDDRRSWSFVLDGTQRVTEVELTALHMKDEVAEIVKMRLPIMRTTR